MISPGNAARHNPRTCEPVLSLSEVECSTCGAGTYRGAEYRRCNGCELAPTFCVCVPHRARIARVAIGAGGRLNDTAARYVELHGPVTPAPAFRAERIAQTIRRDGGNVWGAVLEHGISYAHACRIRAGWRPGHGRAPAIAGSVARRRARTIALEIGLRAFAFLELGLEGLAL